MEVIDKIKKMVTPPTEAEQFQKYIEEFRRKYIPERYNQIKLLEHLNNKDVDHLISISNRTDGKSFNYIHALINICIKYDLGCFMISRNMTLRLAYQILVETIIDESPILDRRDFSFIRMQYYIRVLYNGKPIMAISDLNQASELKNFSNEIKDFPIMVYDEFLVLEGDYLNDEWVRLKTIYESIDRKESYPLIGKPKILYLGNAVNFSSPVLAELDLFNRIEAHPMNTMQVYGNIVMENNKNDNANEERNTRAFDSKDDSMTTGQFIVNKHQLETDNVRNEVNRNRERIVVKLHQGYLIIDYNRETFKTVLSVEGFTKEPYNFNTRLQDNNKESVYLDDSYYKQNEPKRHDKGVYYYKNQYTKEQVTNGGQNIVHINIRKLIRNTVGKSANTSQSDIRDEQYQRNYLEDSKKALFRKFFNQ